jgi:hypothetical protein
MPPAQPPGGRRSSPADRWASHLRNLFRRLAGHALQLSSHPPQPPTLERLHRSQQPDRLCLHGRNANPSARTAFCQTRLPTIAYPAKTQPSPGKLAHPLHRYPLTINTPERKHLSRRTESTKHRVVHILSLGLRPIPPKKPSMHRILPKPRQKLFSRKGRKRQQRTRKFSRGKFA